MWQRVLDYARLHSVILSLAVGVASAETTQAAVLLAAVTRLVALFPG